MSATSLVERCISTTRKLMQPASVLLLFTVCALCSDRLLAQTMIRQDVFTRPAAALDRDPPRNGARSVSGSARVAPEELNLNSATAEQLDDLLPGIGPEKARRIVEWRTIYGPFQSLDQLLEVSGIGPITLENIRPFLTLGDSTTTSGGPTNKSGFNPKVNAARSPATQAVQRIVAAAQRDAAMAGLASAQISVNQ